MSLDQEYNSILNEYVDLSDRETLFHVSSLDEAGQDQLLLSLTDKLYDKIVEKVDHIDFGTIPKSKGDITQIENYDSMNECLDIIRGIVKQYNQPTEPVEQVQTAILNIKERERLFSRCFTMNVELGIVIYNTMVISIVSSLSYLIATSIDFIKSPTDESFQVSLDRVGYNKTTQSVMFNDLRKFNISCKKGEVDKALDAILSQRGVRAMSGDFKDAAIKAGKIAGIALAGYIFTKQIAIPLLKNLIPTIQSLVYLHYSNQQSLSDYFAVQADLLEINAGNINYESNDVSPEQKKKIIEKQMKSAARLRKLSNTFQIKMKGAEVSAEKLATSERKKYSKVDLTDTSGGLF